MNQAIDTLYFNIKATAMNKGRARVWIESDKLAAYGFVRHAPVDITINPAGIVVMLSDTGKRKVAGRERNGRSISILDICMPLEQREAIRNGASAFVVHVQPGIITIQPAK